MRSSDDVRGVELDLTVMYVRVSLLHYSVLHSGMGHGSGVIILLWHYGVMTETCIFLINIYLNRVISILEKLYMHTASVLLLSVSFPSSNHQAFILASSLHT